MAGIRTHRWRVAVGLLVIAQFGAYQGLASRLAESEKTIATKSDELNKRLRDSDLALQRLQGASDQNDKQIAELTATANTLRDKLADTREKRPIDVRLSGAAVPPMPAASEGLRVSVRQVTSPVDAAPYAWEVTVQVASPVQPFGVFIRTSKRPVQVETSGLGFALMLVRDVTDKGATIGWQSPAVTPQAPAILVVMAKEPFSVLGVERIR